MFLLALLLTFRLVPDNASVQFTQPQVAVNGKIVGLTFGSANTIYFSRSEDGGRTFSRPVKVADVPKLALGLHRGPRIAISPQTIVISAGVGWNRDGQHADLVAWRSVNGGRTWSSAMRVNDVPSSAPEGLHAMATGPNGLVYAAWLDLRSKHTQLYGASSRDGGATWSKNFLIYASPDGTICECCHPSLAVTETGQIHVMWRNALRGSRDMYFASSIDGASFTPARKLGEGNWQINACPMDGGSFVADPSGKIFSVWRREDTVFLASPGQREIPLGKGKNPSIALGNGGVYTAWSGPSGLLAKIPGEPQPILLSTDGAFVHLATNGTVIAVWESRGSIVVETLNKRQ